MDSVTRKLPGFMTFKDMTEFKVGSGFIWKKGQREQDEFAASLQHRADIFMGEAAEAGLQTCPYKSGFFIYVPTPTHEQAVEIFDKLAAQNIYVVPLGNGLRIAICAIDDAKIVGMAAKFKAAYDEVVK